MYFQKKNHYVFCPECNAIYPGWDASLVMKQHPDHQGVIGTPFIGVYIEKDFLSLAEEQALMKGIDEMPWQDSQSGRRKQVRYTCIKINASFIHSFLSSELRTQNEL